MSKGIRNCSIFNLFPKDSEEDTCIRYSIRCFYCKRISCVSDSYIETLFCSDACFDNSIQSNLINDDLIELKVCYYCKSSILRPKSNSIIVMNTYNFYQETNVVPFCSKNCFFNQSNKVSLLDDWPLSQGETTPVPVSSKKYDTKKSRLNRKPPTEKKYTLKIIPGYFQETGITNDLNLISDKEKNENMDMVLNDLSDLVNKF